MNRRPLARALAALTLPALVAACPGTPEDDSDASLVVGVQAEELASVVTQVHVVAKVDGVVAADERVASTALPKEVEVRGRAGARVEVEVEGFLQGVSGPAVVRRAAANIVRDAKKLLRVQLEARCANLGAPGGDPAGGSAAPAACAAPLTCAGGRCVSADVAPSDLETYEPGWPGAAPDACRPANHGPPEIILGTGQTDYAPLAEGQVLQLEKGPQGGHHVWIAVRMKNLRQSGSRTSLSAKLVDDPGASIFPAGYVFTFDRDEGGYCKLWGLRFQLDAGAGDLGSAYKKFLGKRVEVTAEVVDTTGARAVATRTIQIADKLLCPDGTTTSCNGP